MCSYDRANVGSSESVAGTQSPKMVVGNLDGLMQAIGDKGPYLLMGQSAGGMVASAYAVAHPDKVAGIVMIDSSFDDEITLEEVGMEPKGAGPCDPSNHKADAEESLQKIDTCTMYKWSDSRRQLVPGQVRMGGFRPRDSYRTARCRGCRRTTTWRRSFESESALGGALMVLAWHGMLRNASGRPGHLG